MSFTDKSLACRDCGNEFVFTAGEQEFYSQKGFDNAPTRCPDCRKARKSSRGDGYGGGSSSSYGGGDSYSSGGRSSGGYSDGGARAEKVQHETVCANCGKATTVPFVPRGNRPVLCYDCFNQQRGGRPSSGGGSGYNRY